MRLVLPLGRMADGEEGLGGREGEDEGQAVGEWEEEGGCSCVVRGASAAASTAAAAALRGRGSERGELVRG